MLTFFINLYRRLPYKYRFLSTYFSWPIRILSSTSSFIRIGEKMFLSAADNACLKYRSENKNYELGTTDLFCSLASKMDFPIAIDVGANYGIYMLNASVLARRGLIKKVIAIEPDINAFKCLQKTVVSLECADLVQIINAACAEGDGRIRFRYNARSSMDNRIYQEDQKNNFVTKKIVEVNSINLGNLIKKDINNQYIFKIDIEGGEYQAIKSMREALLNMPGYTIFFEYFPIALKEAKVNLMDFVNLIKDISPSSFYERKPYDYFKLDQSEFYERLINCEFDESYNYEGPFTEFMISNIFGVEEFMKKNYKPKTNYGEDL